MITALFSSGGRPKTCLDKVSMRRFIRDTFVALVMFSSVWILIGGIGLLDGKITELEDPNRGRHMIQLGAETTEMGLIGVVLFGLLHKRSQQETQGAVSFPTILRRAVHKS